MRIFLPLCSLLFTASLSAQMDNARMDSLLRALPAEMEGEPGGWTLQVGDTPLVVITDERANRMRIFSPVIEQSEVEPDALAKLLEANFHSALDAKYALHRGFVVSVFTHPLAELTDAQFEDALLQVLTLTRTYGTTFSSTDKVFGGGFGGETPQVRPEPKERIKKS